MSETRIITVDHVYYLFGAGHMAAKICSWDQFQDQGDPCWLGAGTRKVEHDVMCECARCVLSTDTSCYCGTPLTFTSTAGPCGQGSCCYCRRCEKRAERDGAAICVYGYGRTRADALANWRLAMESM